MKQALLWAVVGAGIGVAGLVFGLIGMAGALLAAVLVAAAFRNVAGAMVLAGLGIGWLLLFVSSAYGCGRPDQPCGATPLDMTPHIAVAAGNVAAGLALAVYRWRSALARPV